NLAVSENIKKPPFRRKFILANAGTGISFTDSPQSGDNLRLRRRRFRLSPEWRILGTAAGGESFCGGGYGIMPYMRLLLVDATGYLFRAFHAVGDLRTSAGAPSGAIYGMVNMLRKLRERWPAERVACVMDAPGKTFRHELSPQYKANRPPLNPDLRAQIAPAKEFIAAWGWPLLCIEGVEADDVIATLAAQGRAAGMEIVVASADKDLMQIVDDKVRMFDGLRDKLYDAEAVREKFGVPPQQMADYLALVGDASDNIRGVEKVGAKTAAKLLGEFGSLDEILENARDETNIKPGLAARLREAEERGVLPLARKLVALDAAVALPRGAEELTPSAPDDEKWRTLCARYEFRQFAETPASESAVPRAKIHAISELPVLEKWIADARKSGAVALDTETDGAAAMRAKIAGFSMAFDGGDAAYIPLAHDVIGAIQIPADRALAALRPLLEDERVIKIFHNGKYDLHIFANCGLRVRGVLEDTKIAAALLEPGRQNSLAALARRHLNIRHGSYRDLVDGKRIKHFAQVDIASASAYAAADAEIAFQLRAAVVNTLAGKTRNLYEKIERPLMPILHSMERAGVRIDGDALRACAADMRGRMAELEREAHDIAGGAFNLNSPRQLETLLFDKMGAPPLHKTGGGGARSTDERTLEKLAPDYPLAKVLLRHRELAKLCNTYAEKLPRMIHPVTGRVHTDFNQTAVATGRLSSRDPNLQNIPARGADGRRIRRAFVAADGCALISADYSQIELRLMAHISGDRALLSAFAAGKDVHRRTAAEIFGVAEENVDAVQRRAAKAINFGLMYGMSAFGLARALNAPQQQAREYIARYFERYPGVAAFMENIRKEAKRDGGVRTEMGRHIPAASGNPQAAARAAVNAPMQGGAADIVKMAMIKTDEYLRDNRLRTRMVLQVHDELVLESPEDEAEKVARDLPALMCGVATLKVPLEVSVQRAANWDDAH
ncbi:MAG: DNA polymerase I, partial [Gammaproteobacteria bacterium]